MGTRITELDDGWWVATCECGWVSEPVPGPVEAQDEADDHTAYEED